MTKRMALASTLALLLAGCGAHRTAATQAAATQASPQAIATAASAKMPPLYPGAHVDTSQGANGVLDAPSLRMTTNYYKTSDSWDTVSKWYLAKALNWSSVSKPGGGDLTLGRQGKSPATIMVTGDKTGTEIVIERFNTKT